MGAFIRLSWRLCTLEVTPQDLHYSRSLQTLSIAAYFLLGLAVNAVFQSWGIAAVVSALDTGLLIGIAYAALWVRDMPQRATQTTTALAVSGVVLGLIALPIYIALRDATGILLDINSLLSLGLVIWQIIIVAHILRHALAVPFMAASVISLVYAIVAYKIANILIPTPVG
ncbi:MAG: hypothetical protein OEW08_15175 [Gammaproteobacteria bacterium]|nr:hypothetical protein [Gammaproteobacteria bacterium]